MVSIELRNTEVALDLRRVLVDISRMMRNSMILFALATICFGQAPLAQRAQIEEQERRNAVTVTVQPGTGAAIPFSLVPQTWGSDEILISARINVRI